MTALSSRLVTLLTLTSACTTPASVVEPSEPSGASPVVVEPDAAEQAPTRPNEAPGPLEIAIDDRIFRPKDFAPSREVGMTDEPEKIGWSPTTGEFVVCTPSGGAVCNLCQFHHPSRAVERMGVGEDCGDERVPKAKLDARLGAGRFTIENGDWMYGAELQLVVAERQGDPDIDGIARGLVEVGVRRRVGDQVVWLERIEQCFDGYCAPDVHIDAIAPSPDGRTIAVLTHTFAGEYSDTYPLLLLDAEQLAAAASERK